MIVNIDNRAIILAVLYEIARKLEIEESKVKEMYNNIAKLNNLRPLGDDFKLWE